MNKWIKTKINGTMRGGAYVDKTSTILMLDVFCAAAFLIKIPITLIVIYCWLLPKQVAPRSRTSDRKYAIGRKGRVATAALNPGSL